MLTHPWEVFVERWNWKTALLSALLRGTAFALALAGVVGHGVIGAVCIEVGFRVAVGGFWGSLLQAFRNVQPPWLAALSAAVVLPAAAHVLEYSALRAGSVTHIQTGMVVSIAISIASLLVNLGLMRRGVFVTGEGESLRSDLRRLPATLAAMFRNIF